MNSVNKIFKMWSLYPFITRDIAVWVPEGVAPEKLKELYQDMGTELLVIEPQLFDSFTKDGKTSFGYRLVFQSYEKTLTDSEVNSIMMNITDSIRALGWEVR
jgi:phenylalanyl-tRNA synthetase beta subunit